MHAQVRYEHLIVQVDDVVRLYDEEGEPLETFDAKDNGFSKALDTAKRRRLEAQAEFAMDLAAKMGNKEADEVEAEVHDT